MVCFALFQLCSIWWPMLVFWSTEYFVLCLLCQLNMPGKLIVTYCVFVLFFSLEFTHQPEPRSHKVPTLSINPHRRLITHTYWFCSSVGVCIVVKPGWFDEIKITFIQEIAPDVLTSFFFHLCAVKDCQYSKILGNLKTFSLDERL